MEMADRKGKGLRSTRRTATTMEAGPMGNEAAKASGFGSISGRKIRITLWANIWPTVIPEAGRMTCRTGRGQSIMT